MVVTGKLFRLKNQERRDDCKVAGSKYSGGLVSFSIIKNIGVLGWCTLFIYLIMVYICFEEPFVKIYRHTQLSSFS